MTSARRQTTARQSPVLLKKHAQAARITSADAPGKEALVNSLRGVERGLTASPTNKADINELVIRLEAFNPCQNPNEDQLLGGRWNMVYTSNSELLAVLSMSHLPLVDRIDVHQSIDSASSTAENVVTLSLLGSTFSISSLMSLEMFTAKRMGMYFDEGSTGANSTVQVKANIGGVSTDSALEFMEASVQPLIDASTQVVRNMTQQLVAPPAQPANKEVQAKVGSSNSRGAETWMITSYLDEDLCIRRGDGGSVFIYKRERPQDDVNG